MFQLVKLRNLVRLILIGIVSCGLIACGGEDSSPASPLRTGVFFDSGTVEGLNYATPTMNGKTNADGEFTFTAGEQITFSLGELELAEVQAADTITPLTLFPGDDVSVANFSRLLQSMDADGMADNVVSLPPNLAALVTSNTQIDFTGANFDTEAQALLMQVYGPQAILIGTETAMANLNQSLVDNNLVADDCTAEHHYVGRSGELSTLAHGVSGTITVISDCEIEVTNFNYDGQGPSVYFYGAVDRDYSGDSFIIGQRLNGKQWVNDNFRLKIPEGKTLDNFNSLSVWCIDFNANFGDVFFGDM